MSDYIVLDTETTSLNGECLELAIMDSDGKVLVCTLVKPSVPCSKEAQAIHGITPEMLEPERPWDEVYRVHGLEKLFSENKVYAYNAAFDSKILKNTCDLYGIELPPMDWGCVMVLYADAYSKWDASRRCWKFQKLENAIKQQSIDMGPGVLHRALFDTRMALEVLRRVQDKKVISYTAMAKKPIRKPAAVS